MKWIISNHKNVFNIETVDDYINKLNRLQLSNINLVICPSYKNSFYFKNQNFILGSQDIKNIDELTEDLVKYTIVGHSYRRNKYNESDEDINSKIKLLISNCICPILCVGEKEGEDLEEVLSRQIKVGLKDVCEDVIIAYEPVWAINSGKIPDIDNLIKIIRYIKELSNELGINATVLYGGSVNEDTVLKLEAVEEIDGYLIGAVSTEIDKFIRIINIVEGD